MIFIRQMGVGDEPMGTLFNSNARREVLLVIETVGDIGAIEARPAFVEASSAVTSTKSYRRDVGVGIIKPTGDEKFSSISLKHIVYSHPDGKRQGGDGFFAIKAVSGRSHG